MAHMVTTAIALAQAISTFEKVLNDRITITSDRPLVLLGGKANPMQGKVFKVSTYAVRLGADHSYEKKLNKQGNSIATHESIEQDAEIDHLKREIQALWKGAGEWVGGAVVRHKGTGELYLRFFLDGDPTDVKYMYNGQEILPDAIQGFNEKTREGAEISLSNGEVKNTKVFPTTLKFSNLRGFRMGGTDYMVV